MLPPSAVQDPARPASWSAPGPSSGRQLHLRSGTTGSSEASTPPAGRWGAQPTEITTSATATVTARTTLVGILLPAVMLLPVPAPTTPHHIEQRRRAQGRDARRTCGSHGELPDGEPTPTRRTPAYMNSGRPVPRRPLSGCRSGAASEKDTLPARITFPGPPTLSGRAGPAMQACSCLWAW